jgi:hypothetical protein
MRIIKDEARIKKLIAEWRSHPPIASSFPLALPGGGKVDSFSGHCAKCDGEIPDIDLHGSVVKVIPAVATISAVGLCRECSCLTPFHHRLRAVDGSIQSEWINDAGRWVKRTWKKTPTHGTPAAWMRQLSEWLKQRMAGM